MHHKEHLASTAKYFQKVAQHVPGMAEGFMGVKNAVLKDSALTEKEKEYVALGIAIAIRCEGCIEAHVKNLIALGMTERECAEVVGTAVLMGGGPSTVYGAKAMEVYEEFTSEA